MALSADSVLFDVLTSDPGGPVEGQMWFNTTASELRQYRGGATQRVSSRKTNVTTTAPTVSNDNTQGYEPGSFWLNTTASTTYTCMSAATGAAIWVQLAISGGGIGAHYEVNAAGDITSNSHSDIVATSMTLTPGAGTYQVVFSSDLSIGGNGSVYVNCYAGAVLVPNSERTHTREGHTIRVSVAVTCVATVSAAQAIDIRWRVPSNTATMGNRSLFLLKVA
jgi:hypothetical protein